MSIPVIPRKQSLGDYLGQQAGQGLQQGIDQFFEGKQRQKQLQGLSPFLESMGLNPEQIQQFTQSGLDPQQAVQLLGHLQKTRGDQENGLSAQDYGGIVDQLEQMLEEGNVGFGAGLLSAVSPNIRERNSKFNSLGTSLLGLVQKVALKRGITNQREFQTFKNETIPNSRDTVATAKGKLEALREYIKAAPGGQETSASPGNSNEKTTLIKAPNGKYYNVPQSKLNAARKAKGEVVK